MWLLCTSEFLFKFHVASRCAEHTKLTKMSTISVLALAILGTCRRKSFGMDFGFASFHLFGILLSGSHCGKLRRMREGAICVMCGMKRGIIFPTENLYLPRHLKSVKTNARSTSWILAAAVGQALEQGGRWMEASRKVVLWHPRWYSAWMICWRRRRSSQDFDQKLVDDGWRFQILLIFNTN